MRARRRPYCWDELGRIEKDPDERIVTVIDLVFRKFRELGSARQVLLWARDADLKLPVYRQGRGTARRIDWRSAAYHTTVGLLKHPIYAGVYVFGRTQQRTHLDGDRARKTEGHQKEQQHWSVLIRDHHIGYISWDEFSEHQRMLAENAHMQKRASRKSGRGGRALLTGMVRCGRCRRMMRVFYGSRSGNAHRHLCCGGMDQDGGRPCIGAGGVRIDRAAVAQIIEAVSPHAIEGALQARYRVAQEEDEIRQTRLRELDEATYEAALAARRHAAVDPEKRLVAKALEARWNTALEEVERIQQDLAKLDRKRQARPDIDRDALMALAQDLPTAWDAPGVRP